MTTNKEKASLRLMKAAKALVEAYGGSVVVAGDIRVQHYPDDPKCNFEVVVKCTGKLPEFK